MTIFGLIRIFGNFNSGGGVRVNNKSGEGVDCGKLGNPYARGYRTKRRDADGTDTDGFIKICKLLDNLGKRRISYAVVGDELNNRRIWHDKKIVSLYVPSFQEER